MAVRDLEAVQQLSGSAVRAESRPGRIGPISLGATQTGERRAGNPHAAPDVAGTGNMAWSRCCEHSQTKGETTGNTNIDLTGAPVLDPTCERPAVQSHAARRANKKGRLTVWRATARRPVRRSAVVQDCERNSPNRWGPLRDEYQHQRGARPRSSDHHIIAIAN